MNFVSRFLQLVGTAFLFSQTGISLAADNDAFPSDQAEYFFRMEYANKTKHKAFAIGPYGVFGYSWGYATVKQAKSIAMAECATAIRDNLKKFGLSGKCQLLAVGGTILLKDPWIGTEWQKPAAGTDIPLYNGRTLLVSKTPAQGVVLALHGCDGPGASGYNKVWGDYFNALGFDYYAPNSFSEPRPKALCRETDPRLARQRTEITNIRIAQTQRTIALLRAKYPKKPIYIWGHSEGAYIAKRLVTKVSGVIASGDDCDVGGLPVAAHTSVPVLYMFGENDPVVDGLDKPITNKNAQKCKRFVRSKKTQIAVIRNAAHDLYPWREDIAKAVSSFVGATTSGHPKPIEKITFPLTPVQQTGLKDYNSRGDHRAFAVSKSGSFGWSDGWENAEDAAYHSLYLCETFERINMFSLETHQCTLLSVDGKERQIPTGR